MKEYWNLLKEINGTWLKPMPFSCSVVVVFLVQLCIANNWLDNHIGKYYGFGILVALLIVAIGVNWISNIRVFDFRRINEITPLDTFLYGTLLTTFSNLVCFSLHWSIVSPDIILLFLVILGVTVRRFCRRLNQIYKAHENRDTNKLSNKLIN